MRLRVLLAGIFFFACRPTLLPSPARTKGVGAACANDIECRAGMACVASACAPSADLPLGSRCDLSAGCVDGAYCSIARVCERAGSGAAEAPCRTSADCQRGLACLSTGLFSVCASGGSTDVGGACQRSSECLAGLACDTITKACAAGIDTLVPPAETSVNCQAEPGTAFRSYFEVPAAGAAPADFFRLPFPNEARNRGDAYDLSGFPGPSGGMAARYVEAMATESGGFSHSHAVTMRFSQALKHMPQSPEKVALFYDNSASANVKLYQVVPVDAAAIGEKDADFGCFGDAFDGAGAPKWRFVRVGGAVSWKPSSAQTPYACSNSLTFRIRTDTPFEGGALYALVLTTSVQSATDQALAPDADLAAILAASAPEDARLARAYKCYGPLRAALEASKRDGSPIDVGQAVLFRTQDATAAVRAVAKTLASLPPEQRPAVQVLVKCGQGAVSPCQVEGETSRACPFSESMLYDEYHGKLRVPVLQTGTRPYLVDGGAIEYTADGSTRRRAPKRGDSAVVQGSEDVCFSLTLPKTGFDATRAVAIFGHDGGGHFRSFTTLGQTDSAEAMVSGSDLASFLSSGSPSVAVLSFDQPLHGPRAGAPHDPALLYFNLGNPRALRDNPLQGVADYAQFVAWLKDLAAGSALFAEAVDSAAKADVVARLANNRRLLIGHGQGGASAALYLSVAPASDVGAAVLSGTGGSFIQTLLGRVQPLAFIDLLRHEAGDPDMSEFHPLLNLVQATAERADPITVGPMLIGVGSAARSLQAAPAPPSVASAPPRPTSAAKSLLHVIGLGDSVTPNGAASDLWRTLGSVPVYAASADGEPEKTLFRSTPDDRTASLALIDDATATGSASGLSCNCLPIATPFSPANPVDGACAAQSVSDPTTLARRTTASAVVYKPERSDDGHLVLFEHPSARGQMKTFLQTAAQATNGFCGASSPRIAPN